MCLLILCVCLCLLQQNAGAEHKGKFSRLTYFYSPTGKANSFPVSPSSLLKFLAAAAGAALL